MRNNPGVVLLRRPTPSQMKPAAKTCSEDCQSDSQKSSRWQSEKMKHSLPALRNVEHLPIYTSQKV